LPSELYAVVLHTVDIAVAARASPGELTDDQLAEACASSAGQGEEYMMSPAGIVTYNIGSYLQAGDIIILKDCNLLRDVSCVASLEQMQMLDVSGCRCIDANTITFVVAVHRWGASLMILQSALSTSYIPLFWPLTPGNTGRW
jgi:hypothetical protein